MDADNFTQLFYGLLQTGKSDVHHLNGWRVFGYGSMLTHRCLLSRNCFPLCEVCIYVCWCCRVRINIKDLPEDQEQDLWLDVEDPKEEVRSNFTGCCAAMISLMQAKSKCQIMFATLD